MLQVSFGASFEECKEPYINTLMRTAETKPKISQEHVGVSGSARKQDVWHKVCTAG